MMGNNPLTAEATRLVSRSFRSRFMRRNPKWNRMGPPLPLWFRLRLKRIDPRLVLQYIPPKSKDPAGLPDDRFPAGAWYICGKLKRNRDWISKRAIFVLMDDDGRPCKPTHDLVRLLRMARNERRHQGINALETQFERSVDELAKAKKETARKELAGKVVGLMRKLNMSGFVSPRVFFPAQPMGHA